MRVLLAGATGVIGRQAVPVLAVAGHQVTGLARTPIRLPDAEVLAVDALDRAAVADAVRSARPDVIVHMLTAVPDPVDPRHLARDMGLTNRLRTQGTANLVAAAGGARVIAQGVAYAYDPAGSPVKNEDAPLWHDPPAEFGPELAALVEQERRVTWAGGLVLRLGHLYGPGSSFAPDGGFARRLRAGKVPLVGDGASMFSFIHAHDVATAILAAVEHPAASGVCNIVDDQPTLIHDWLPEMAAMLGAPAPRHVPAWLARLSIGEWGMTYMTGMAGASNRLARHQLDWKPTYSTWRDGMAADLASAPPDEHWTRLPVSRQRGVAGGGEHRWALASTTRRHGGAKLGGEGLHGLVEGGLR
jgi:nucleoside-diphosphate-sugar epimerase